MVPLWRTAGSPIRTARCASAGIASPTTAELATSACFAVAPITSERPFISIVLRPSIWERSTRGGGVWGGCFFTGTRVCEPLLHDRNQRVAAGDYLGVLVLGEEIGGLPYGAGTMIFEVVH